MEDAAPSDRTEDREDLDPKPEEAIERALGILRKCATEHGFLASPTPSANYHRVWGRDGAIVGLAALLTEDEDLVETARITLETLAEYQGPHGEIPSNVDPVSGRISYGGTTGRVDADLWFVIGCGEYFLATENEEFLERILPALRKVVFLLGAWEFNNRGLLYIPQTGDWADEYIHNGYVLYDQVLYLQALRTLGAIHSVRQGTADHALEERIGRLCHLIRGNYWIDPDEEDGASEPSEDVYHPILYEHGIEAARRCEGRYWMPFFSPTGYGYRFDAFANVLTSLLGVASREQSEAVDATVDSIVPDELPLLPAFHPVIQPVDEADWKTLHRTFSYKFKNRPFEFHNGGLWTILTAFHAADLVRRGREEQARKYVGGIHRANALAFNDGEPWGFAEYVHGKKLTPGGTRHQAWSAAASLIGESVLGGEKPFKVGCDGC
jgi:hypothetical protein